MADDQNQDTGAGQAPAWGDKTPEQLYNELQEATKASAAYRDALGGVDAEAARQGWEWARQAAAAIQQGTLKYATQQEPPVEPTKTAAPDRDELGLPVNYDELPPREQALTMTRMIQEANKAALKEMVAAEAQSYGKQIQDWMTRSEQEKGLLFQVLEASRTNPKLDVKAALEKASQLKAMSPDQLLQYAISGLSQPDPNATLNDQVSKLVAEKLQEAENKRLEAAFGINGTQRKVSLKKTARNRDEVNRDLMKLWTNAGYKLP